MSGGAPRLDERWQAAFLGAPTHVRLAPGEHLYKFTTIPIMRQRIFASPWWIRQHDFDLLQQAAVRIGRPLTEVVRSQMTLAVDWTMGMETIFAIVLGRSLDAWEGPSALRGSDGPSSAGGKLLCVPGVTVLDVAREYSGAARR